MKGMPTMEKKIQSNVFSLTAAVWAKLAVKNAEAGSIDAAKPTSRLDREPISPGGCHKTS